MGAEPKKPSNYSGFLGAERVAIEGPEDGNEAKPAQVGPTEAAKSQEIQAATHQGESVVRRSSFEVFYAVGYWHRPCIGNSHAVIQLLDELGIRTYMRTIPVNA